MKGPYYHFESSEDKLSYVFESVSDEKIVMKIVEYTPFEYNSSIYNLAFGDMNEDGFLDDLSISNNQDMERILATVIQTTFSFFRTYPNKKLFFTGSTPARTRLYRAAINKVINDLKEEIVVEGIINEVREPFQKDIHYSAFLIYLKPKI